MSAAARIVGRAGAAVALALLAGGAGPTLTFLDPQGPVAAQQRWHFFWILGLMMVVVLPVLILTPWLARRYRYGRHHDYEPRWRFAWGWEITLWGVPTMIAAVLAVLLWRSTTALDPYEPLDIAVEPLRVQAIGYDWKWLFVYPDLGVATVNRLVFPAGRPLALELTSETVMQALWIPALGGQIYAMDGMVTRLHLAADGPGRFRGLNTQYNGLDFPRQRFEAVAMTDAGFAGWLRETRDAGVALDAEAYDALARRGTPEELAEALGAGRAPLRFASVPAGLFERAAAQRPAAEMAP